MGRNMKLYEFSGAETDWVAAEDEASARRCLRSHYGISEEDIAGSYSEIHEVDPAEVSFFTDEYDEENEETVTMTAAEMMSGKAHPFVVGSTYE